MKANLTSSSFALITSEGYDNNVSWSLRYDNNVLNINADKTLPSVYGTNENSSLNCLQYYHVINGPPPDIAHDIFDGFATDFLQKFLRLFHTIEILDTWNIKYINKLLQLFPYWST